MLGIETLIQEVRKNKVYSTLKLDETKNQDENVSLIIGSTLQLIEDITRQGIKKFVVVTPESESVADILAYLKTVSDIVNKELDINYDLSNFKKGRKYKYKNAIVEYNGQEEGSNGKMLCLNLKDGKYKVPIDLAPKLQFIETNKNLTTLKKFSSIFNIKDYNNNSKDISQILLDFKTHSANTNFYVPSVLHHKDKIKRFSIEDKWLLDLLYIAKPNSNGDFISIVKGQYSGNPSIILTKDLFDVRDAYYEDTKINSIIISANSNSIFEDQIQILDELIKEGIQVILITNNEFAPHLKELAERDFLIWRWGKKELRAVLKEQYTDTSLDFKANIYSFLRTTIINCGTPLLSRIIMLLNRFRNNNEGLPPAIEESYNYLLSITLKRLRQFLPLTSTENHRTFKEILQIEKELSEWSSFVSPEILETLKVICKDLKGLFDIENHKAEQLISKLEDIKSKDIVLIIDSRQNIEETKHFLNYSSSEDLNTNVKVMHPADFFTSNTVIEIAILGCWFNEATMKKLVYGNQIRKIYILLYDKEKEWAQKAFLRWKKLSKFYKDNDKILNNLYGIKMPESEKKQEKPKIDKKDELEELENTILRSHIHRYTRTNHDNSEENVEAGLIGFDGGYFAFFTDTHKLLKINSILSNDDGVIDQITVDKANIGDYILVRHSERSLIREIADKILNNTNLEEERKTASLWREPLLAIYNKYGLNKTWKILKEFGCTRTYMTVRMWIHDENRIGPRDKDDIAKILMAANRKDLLSQVDKIHEAIYNVDRAHVKAGFEISKLLRNSIGEYISSRGSERIKRANDVVKIDVEKIGTVLIYQISKIDLQRYKVSPAHVNTVLQE